MSFFALNATCSVCGQEAGLNRKRIANKEWICSSCYKNSNLRLTDFMSKPINKWTVDDFKIRIEANTINKDELEAFTPTKKIGSFVEFDDNRKKWLVLSSFLGSRKKSIVYNHSDIIDFDLLEDGESVAQGGLGRALVGGALFGGTGAIIGGVTGKRKQKGVCNSLELKITVNDMNNPAVFIKFIAAPTKRNGIYFKTVYKQAQECLSMFQLICNQQNDSNGNEISQADELRKFKELLDMGAITKEEYESKKKEILHL